MEEVSDDDLPEVIEERRYGVREEIVSDADSNFSMVSNNSLSGENSHTLDKEHKSKKDGMSKNSQGRNHKQIQHLQRLVKEIL